MSAIVNPQTVAFLVFDPVTAALVPGSWGGKLTILTPAQKYRVTLSKEYAGDLTVDQAATLSVLPTIHEIYAGYTLTPIAGGFEIDFGAALVRTVTIKVEKILGQA